MRKKRDSGEFSALKPVCFIPAVLWQLAARVQEYICL